MSAPLGSQSGASLSRRDLSSPGFVWQLGSLHATQVYYTWIYEQKDEAFLILSGNPLPHDILGYYGLNYEQLILFEGVFMGEQGQKLELIKKLALKRPLPISFRGEG